MQQAKQQLAGTPVQALVEGVHTVEKLLHMILVVADSHWIAVEVVAAQ